MKKGFFAQKYSKHKENFEELFNLGKKNLSLLMN